MLVIGGIATLVLKAGLVRWPLKVTTGPYLEGGPVFISTLTQVVAEERPLVRLKPIKKDSLAASAKAMEKGETDLAHTADLLAENPDDVRAGAANLADQQLSRVGRQERRPA